MLFITVIDWFFITRKSCDDTSFIYFANAVTVGVGDVDIPGIIDRYSYGIAEACFCGRPAITRVILSSVARNGCDDALLVYLANRVVARVGNEDITFSI